MLIEGKHGEAVFSGSAGYVDCCTLTWENCPLELQGQYHNSKDGKMATIKIEACCDRDPYISHWFAGRHRTNNDQTMVSLYPLFSYILSGRYVLKLPCTYNLTTASISRDEPYFLGEGIYQLWPIPINRPDSRGEDDYSKRQEVIRKDIERCFGVLKTRLRTLRHESAL